MLGEELAICAMTADDPQLLMLMKWRPTDCGVPSPICTCPTSTVLALPFKRCSMASSYLAVQPSDLLRVLVGVSVGGHGTQQRLRPCRVTSSPSQNTTHTARWCMRA